MNVILIRSRDTDTLQHIDARHSTVQTRDIDAMIHNQSINQSVSLISLTLCRSQLPYEYSYKASYPMPDRVKKPPFVIFDIRALWRSRLSVRVPGCQKLQMTALTVILYSCTNMATVGAKGLGSQPLCVIACTRYQHWPEQTTAAGLAQLSKLSWYRVASCPPPSSLCCPLPPSAYQHTSHHPPLTLSLCSVTTTHFRVSLSSSDHGHWTLSY